VLVKDTSQSTTLVLLWVAAGLLFAGVFEAIFLLDAI
jgi:hypothetical protein